jgi:hypothetical protein
MKVRLKNGQNAFTVSVPRKTLSIGTGIVEVSKEDYDTFLKNYVDIVEIDEKVVEKQKSVYVAKKDEKIKFGEIR